MEPKALANLNGMLVPTPVRNGGGPSVQRECQTAPATPANASGRGRRDSSLWVRTPEDDSEDSYQGEGEPRNDAGDEDEDSVWGTSMLMPVPKTPAPETIARYVEAVTPDTPTEDGADEDERLRLVTRTCPPKQQQQQLFQALGEGVLARDKDESVLQRLMAARRKSLQFAPKVGSPLARTWN